MWWAYALLTIAASTPDSGYRLDRSRIDISGAIFADDDITAVNPTLSTRLVVSRRWAFEARLPGAARLDTPGTTVVGNASAAALFRDDLTGVGRVEAGLRLGVPTARSANEADRGALDVATQMTGFVDDWAYRPDTLSLSTPVRFESTSPEGLAFWGEGLPVLGLPTDGGEISGLLALTLGAAYRTRWAEARVAFGLAMLLLPELEFEGQLYVEPGLRFNFARVGRSVVFGGAALRMNLDEPAGFAFDGGFYAVTARLGVEFSLPGRA